MHWFLDPITKHYADFSGRTSRQAFWMYNLINILLVLAIFVVSGILGASTAASGDFAMVVASLGSFFVILVLLGLALFVPSLAIAVRRLHDTGRSGWWILVGIIPYIGSIALLVLYCLPSQDGTNSYGPHPYAPEAQPVEAPAPAVASPVEMVMTSGTPDTNQTTSN